jgi:hypothetical protein
MTKPSIKFQKHFVTNGTEKARVSYSHGPLCVYENGRVVGTREAITLYAKDYGHALGRVFADVGGYQNDTDSQTDYFDKGRVRIFPDSPLWDSALERCELQIAQHVAKREAKLAKYIA